VSFSSRGIAISRITLTLLTLGLILAPKIQVYAETPDVKKASRYAFDMSEWGHYWVTNTSNGIYFMNYIEDSPLYYLSSNINRSERAQILKVLVDDNSELTITSGTPLSLEDGYVLALRSVDIDGNKVYLELTKDGETVDMKVLTPSVQGTDIVDNTYYYRKDIGDSKDVVIIAIHFKNAFRGADQDLATIDGEWQLSDELTNLRDTLPLVPIGEDFSMGDWGSFWKVLHAGKEYFVGYIDGGYLHDASVDPYLADKMIITPILLDETHIGVKNESIILEEGYELHMNSIDIDGNKVYIELYKDGTVVDSDIIDTKDDRPGRGTYAYSTNVGKAKPVVIAVHFKNAFRCADANYVSVDRIWQVSEQPIEVGV